MTPKNTYMIAINETQLSLLLTAMIQCQEQGYFGADAEGREEIDVIAALLADLPSIAADNPGAVYDFTI